MIRSSMAPLRQLAVGLCAVALLVVTACGGGGGSVSGTPLQGGTAAPLTMSQGVITGFGSVIVNGVRWDDSSASVADDNGVSHASSDLKLGMTVSIDGGNVDAASGSGKAQAIRFGAEMLGPVGMVDAAGSTFTLLGQTITVNASTVFDANIAGGLAGLSGGQVVEVHGLFDVTSNSTVATRVQLNSSATEYRLRGSAAAVDTVAKTFMIGDQLISYASATEVAPGLANGVQVKVRLQTAQVAGVWQANAVRLIKRSQEDRQAANVEGAVTQFTSATSFQVDGLQVDAATALFVDGQAGVVLGAHVEVQGAIVNSVLVATKVKLEDVEHSPSMGSRPYELHGTISALDTTAKTFLLRGLTVNYGGSVTFAGGKTEANLVDGVKLEVKGALSADKTRIDATTIQFEG
jgi:hypothetical protein